MKLGIIGAGKWGTNFLKEFIKLGADVKWICSTREETMKKALEEANADAKITTNYKDILEDKEVDAVAIATPDATHYQITKDSLEAGKHVLVEKPFTLNSGEAEELVKLANERKRILMIGHIHRFNPGIQKLKEGIDAGLFGKIKHIRLTATHFQARDDTSVLWDFIPHDLTIMPFLLGSYPESVSANGASFRNGILDIVTVNMKFGDVFTVSFASWVYPVKKRVVIVIGDKASASYDDYARELTYFDDKTKTIKFEKTPLAEELKHFLDCVENNKHPLTDGEEGLKVVKILEACEESIKKNGQEVKVE